MREKPTGQLNIYSMPQHDLTFVGKCRAFNPSKQHHNTL